MYLRTLERCFNICELDPAKFLLAPGLVFQAALVKLDLLTNIDMLLMVEKRIRGRICHATITLEQL